MKRMIIAVAATLSIVGGMFHHASAVEKDVKEVEMKRVVYVSPEVTSKVEELKEDMKYQSKVVKTFREKKRDVASEIKSQKSQKDANVQNQLMEERKSPFVDNLQDEPWETQNFAYREIDTNAVKKILKEKKISERIKTLEVEKKKLSQNVDMEKQVLSQMKIDLQELNSLDGVVFNPNDVTELSNISVKQMRQILQDTDLQEFAPVYVRIEKELHINAIAICALSALESGWGTSKRAKEDHNYTGFGVYSDEAEGINAASGEENLLMTAKHIREKYLTKGAVYDNGPSLVGINTMYCVGDTWAYKITDIGYRLMAKLNE
ncbi:hypothetical protein DW019_11315 [Clostridium sp. AF37-5]|jgi:beta-N-acetylglucosaminidase|uniref:glucosaminidase domain-containing protein n=1 Tax=Clostridium sp. AF37-5 TaxID=2293016 RepID=UPI000E4D01B3|nr:glucosaminidase domain-containing protein [Clostridium sp. AF37-5]RHO95834.1 hypothetical protein DW019_11315 [Clostridium sp. AF37-5]